MSEEMWLRRALFQKDSLLGGPTPVPVILGVGRVPEAVDTLPHAAWQCLAKSGAQEACVGHGLLGMRIKCFCLPPSEIQQPFPPSSPAARWEV